MKTLFFLIFILSFLQTLNASKLIQNEYVKITKEEQEFLKNNTIKVITSTTWAPLNMSTRDKEFTGIAIDFWNLISKRANISSEIIEANTWNEVLDKIKRKEADITLSTTYDKNKLDYATFTTSYISFPIAFATLYDKRFIPDGSFLEGKKVAVGENYSAYINMNSKYPNIRFIQVKNTQEALKLLSAKEVDAVIDILPVIAHLISINGYSHIKIAGTSKEVVSIAFMIRKDYKYLKQLINRHISLLSPEDKNMIVRQWLTVKFDQKIIDKDTLINLLLIILFLILFFIYNQWNNTIHKEKLEFLSNSDSLTGLKNRRKIDKILNEEIKNKKFSIILMDIDHFKKINDNYGHLVGDKVLIEISNILKENVNANDIIGRWGGEEFLIICKNTTIYDAQKLANRLRTLLEKTEINKLKITSSFGISEAKNEYSLKEILANADKALYKAKESGRNQAVIWKN